MEVDVTTFDLGGISFNDGVADTDGIAWYGYVDGWDTIDNNVQEYKRPAVHGAITTMNLYNPKQMTLFATAVFVDVECSAEEVIPDVYYLARDKLDAATASFTQFADPQVLLTHHEEVDRSLTVFRTSLRTRCLSGIAMEIELTMRADDPIKTVGGS
jgi:hypothetical protein